LPNIKLFKTKAADVPYGEASFDRAAFQPEYIAIRQLRGLQLNNLDQRDLHKVSGKLPDQDIVKYGHLIRKHFLFV
jgi:hypothetical protein